MEAFFPLTGESCDRPETHRSVYTLWHRPEYLQRRKDTFSLVSLLVEAVWRASGREANRRTPRNCFFQNSTKKAAPPVITGTAAFVIISSSRPLHNFTL